MTSQSESLGKQLQRFNLSLPNGKQGLEILERNAGKIGNFLRESGIEQRRSHENLHEKQILRLNVNRYVQLRRFGLNLDDNYYVFKNLQYFADIAGLMLNASAFLNTIEMLGDTQQIEFWKQQITNGKAIGGYVQTQLGHGSNVQGLQTQAHYDQSTQTFKIISPTVTSAKFWPGVLGLFSTHALMQAQTFVKGKSIGIQTFVIQIRNQNLEPLKGVQAGDIGPKLGFDRVDNGYLFLNNLFVPRRALLMKYVQVEADGKVIGLENKQAIKYGYGSMLFLRVRLVYGFAFAGIIYPAKQLYQIYKKMGALKEETVRRKLIEYFSIGQGLLISNYNIQNIYNQLRIAIKEQNYKRADKLLAQCHILSSTFKALASWKALKVVTEITQTSQLCLFRANLLPKYFSDSIPSVTYEGDNSVLLQQTAKFILMKSVDSSLQKPKANILEDDFDSVLKVLEYVTALEIQRIKQLFKVAFEKGETMNTIWNQNFQREIIEVSKLWGNTNLVKSFIEALKTISEHKELFINVGKVYIKNLLGDTPQVSLYGFQIEEKESWRLITDEQLEAMAYFRKITFDSDETPGFQSRSEEWMRAKL